MDFYVFVIAMTGTVGVTSFLVILALALHKLITRRKDRNSLSEEEGQMLQELWNGLQKMEDRINNLETILIHRERR